MPHVNIAINTRDIACMKEIPPSVAGAGKTEEGPSADRLKREQELNALWKSTPGQRQVLNLLWKIRGPATPLRAGDSVFQLILNHEFGPLPA